MADKEITTERVGPGFADIKQEFVLEDKPRTKTVFKAEISEKGVRGRIIRYRKDKSGNCEDIPPLNFNKLNAYDGVKIELHTDAINTLFDGIESLKQLLSKIGVPYGKKEFSIADSSSLIIDDKNKADIIKKLLEADYGEEVWAELSKSNPDIATRLAKATLQTDRETILCNFKGMIDSHHTENEWQKFFEKNTWIFGYGLRYQILKVTQNQPSYGGSAVSGEGIQRGDFLMNTEADVRFTCLVEIKKPDTPLLQSKEYRNGAWGISSELSGAVAQIQTNCNTWETEGSRTEQSRDFLEDINTVSPRGIIVIGKTEQLSSRDMKKSFERFRCEIRNPEIITYDELYERAKFIVGNHSQTSDKSKL